MKNFCSLKVYMKRLKRQAIAKEDIFANHISDKVLPSRIFGKSLKPQQ